MRLNVLFLKYKPYLIMNSLIVFDGSMILIKVEMMAFYVDEEN